MRDIHHLPTGVIETVLLQCAWIDHLTPLYVDIWIVLAAKTSLYEAVDPSRIYWRSQKRDCMTQGPGGPIDQCLCDKDSDQGLLVFLYD